MGDPIIIDDTGSQAQTALCIRDMGATAANDRLQDLVKLEDVKLPRADLKTVHIILKRGGITYDFDGSQLQGFSVMAGSTNVVEGVLDNAYLYISASKKMTRDDNYYYYMDPSAKITHITLQLNGHKVDLDGRVRVELQKV